MCEMPKSNSMSSVLLTMDQELGHITCLEETRTPNEWAGEEQGLAESALLSREIAEIPIVCCVGVMGFWKGVALMPDNIVRST